MYFLKYVNANKYNHWFCSPPPFDATLICVTIFEGTKVILTTLILSAAVALADRYA
jgi:hypothetical protein